MEVGVGGGRVRRGMTQAATGVGGCPRIRGCPAGEPRVGHVAGVTQEGR